MGVSDRIRDLGGGTPVKSGKRPTVKQSNLMRKFGLEPSEWFVVKHTPTFILVLNRETNETKELTL